MNFAPSRTIVLVSLLLASPLAVAQTASSPTLTQAVSLAFTQGPDLANARASLEDAQANLAASKADPSALITELIQDQQAVELATAQVAAIRLNVMQNVVGAYLTLWETQQNVALLKSQASLDAKNVQIAQAKLQAKSGTSLDVAKAQTTLNSTQQNLANAQAQLTVQQDALAKLFGQTAEQITAKAPQTPPTLKMTLTQLSQGLATRLTSLIQAQNTVETSDLTVKLSNNDYTPRLTLQAAQTKAQTARRDLTTAQKTAINSLTDAYRAAQDTFERIAIQQRSVSNARTTLTQAQARYNSGVISKVELDTTAQALENAEYALTQAQDAYWKALAALSVASGIDVTGLAGSGS